ncbi:uncharacterized protein [Diadema antillarum]|uniref:uncharacterized protein n=1 Tax=Diadema antillarum TaxID=105358 RepID=UPI003A8BEBCE
MDYNYLSQPSQGHHPEPEYGHPAVTHAQHAVYQQPLQLHQSPQVSYPANLLSPHFRHPATLHEPLAIGRTQPADISRNPHVVTVSAGDSPVKPPPQTPMMVYQPEVNLTSQSLGSAPSMGVVVNQHGTSGMPMVPAAPSVSNALPIPSPPAPLRSNSTNPLMVSQNHPCEESLLPEEGLAREASPQENSSNSSSGGNLPVVVVETVEDDEDPSFLGGPIPEGLKYRRAQDEQVCVVACKTIIKGVQFGPLKGTFGKGTIHFNNNLSWELTLEGAVVGFLSPIREEKTWTTMVRCARFPEEQTVEVSQICGRIYFITTREIQAGEELRVFYSDVYREACGFKQGLADLKYNRETQSFECNSCPCHCSSSKSLLRHMKLFHQKEKQTAIDVSLPPWGSPLVREATSAQNKEPMNNTSPVANGEMETPKEKDLRPFVCKTCGKHFTSEGRLLMHRKFHIEESEEEVVSVARDCHCQTCGFRCPDKAGLEDHVKKHEMAPFGCGECGQVYTKQAVLERHKVVKHGDSRTCSKVVYLRLRVPKKATYACSRCGFVCKSKQHLQQHTKGHKNSPHGCSKCGKVYVLKSTLERHLQKQHGSCDTRMHKEQLQPKETKDFKCSQCGFNCPSEAAHTDHIEKHTNAKYGCDLCGRVYTQRQFVGRHKRHKHGVVLPEKSKCIQPIISPFACSECNKGYAYLKSLRRHQREKHGHMSEAKYTVNNLIGEGPGDFECDLCVETFTTGADFNAHLRSAHGIEPNVKEIKSSKADAGSLNGHATPGVPQSKVPGGTLCYICGKTFLKWTFLHSHLRQHHGIEPSVPSDLPDAPGECESSANGDPAIRAETEIGQIDMLGKPVDYYNRPRPFKCKHCPRRFTYRHVLKRHEYRAHLGGSKFTCSFCQKGFDGESQLLVHIQTHTKNRPFKCSLCTRSFASQQACDNHQGEHTGAKPHKCEVCGRGFGTRKLVNKHKYRVHSNKEKRFKCSFCDKRFLMAKDHRIHERRHKGIRPFVCLTCGKGFKDKHCMEVHTRVHTGEKPFVCPHCGKAFSLSHRLTDHIVMHTKENMEQAATAQFP